MTCNLIDVLYKFQNECYNHYELDDDHECCAYIASIDGAARLICPACFVGAWVLQDGSLVYTGYPIPEDVVKLERKQE